MWSFLAVPRGSWIWKRMVQVSLQRALAAIPRLRTVRSVCVDASLSVSRGGVTSALRGSGGGGGRGGGATSTVIVVPLDKADVFPTASVAVAVYVCEPFGTPVSDFDQLPNPSVAAVPCETP